MTLHRIYTEDKNREAVYAILDTHAEGYTVFTATGSRKGQRENSLVIEFLDSDDTFGPIVEAIADAIKAANSQESVMIVAQPVRASFR